MKKKGVRLFHIFYRKNEKEKRIKELHIEVSKKGFLQLFRTAQCVCTKTHQGEDLVQPSHIALPLTLAPLYQWRILIPSQIHALIIQKFCDRSSFS